MPNSNSLRIMATKPIERSHKPSTLPMSPSIPQPIVDVTDDIVTARLPSGDSVQVYLYGATVTSWKTSNNKEQLFLSTAAALDGSKPIRGGIPLVFPVFGPPPSDHATSKLPQHGFARNSQWEFLGKSSSENTGKKTDDSIKLDFGLSSGILSEDNKQKWPYEFSLVYSVTLGKGTLESAVHVQNNGSEAFEFQCLFHTYLSVPDISKTTVSGLSSFKYVDKVRSAQTFTESSSALPIASEVDRVYTTPAPDAGSAIPDITVQQDGKPLFVVKRDAMPDVTVWNGWIDKLKGMGDFEPKDGYKRYLCIEPGLVDSWTKLEAGDQWYGSALMEAKL